MNIVEQGEIFYPNDADWDLAVAFGREAPDGYDAYYYVDVGGGFGSSKIRPMARGRRMIVAQRGFKPLTISGLLEEDEGRLQYIDGCSDTLLLHPPRKGDPCVNFLHLPRRINQTMHTHPSPRIGLVISGSGYAEMGDGSTLPLLAGAAWYLPTNEEHCFHTEDDHLSILAYHPDSDWGPEDEEHPMKNRTIVGGRRVQDLIVEGLVSVGEKISRVQPNHLRGALSGYP